MKSRPCNFDMIAAGIQPAQEIGGYSVLFFGWISFHVQGIKHGSCSQIFGYRLPLMYNLGSNHIVQHRNAISGMTSRLALYGFAGSRRHTFSGYSPKIPRLLALDYVHSVANLPASLVTMFNSVTI